jgi:hypothetical protein
MKNSFVYSQDTTASQVQPCSEKACVTCFENRGCIYDYYPIEVTNNVEESQVQTQKNIAPRSFSSVRA